MIEFEVDVRIPVVYPDRGGGSGHSFEEWFWISEKHPQVLFYIYAPLPPIHAGLPSRIN